MTQFVLFAAAGGGGGLGDIARQTGEQFGWYALAMDQPRTAEQWFAQVLSWKADYEPAAYGLGVARLRLDDTAGLAAVKQAWGKRSERIARLGEGRGEEDASVPPRRKLPVASVETQERAEELERDAQALASSASRRRSSLSRRSRSLRRLSSTSVERIRKSPLMVPRNP